MSETVEVYQYPASIVEVVSEPVVEVYHTGVISTGGAQGTTDHAALTNLTTGDPHTQYLLETGGTVTGEVLFSGTNDRTARFVTSAPIVTTDKHTVEIAYNGTTGTTNTALNVYSANPEMSAMWLRGVDSGTGTLKITHEKPAAADANASALSIDLTGASTAAKAIYVDADTTTGDILEARTSINTTGFRIKADGSLYIRSNSPQIELYDNDGTADARRWRYQVSGSTFDIYQMNDSGSATHQGLRLGSGGNVFLAHGVTAGGTPGNVQIGSNTGVFGGGTGVIGISNSTVAPSSTVSGGIAMYSDTGVLKYRSGNTIYTLDGSVATHSHGTADISALDAGDVTTGTFDIARIPTGSTGTTVSLGNHVHAGVYQPVDADLTAIAALAGTSGLLKKTAADTWTLDTAAYITGITVQDESSNVVTGTTQIDFQGNAVVATAGTGEAIVTITGFQQGTGTGMSTAGRKIYVGPSSATPSGPSTDDIWIQW